MRIWKWVGLFWVVLAPGFAAAQTQPGITLPGIPADVTAPLSPEAGAIAQALAYPSAALSAYGLRLDQLRSFYERRSYEPAWSGNAGNAGNAAAALDALTNAASDGLDKDAFHVEAIVSRLQGRSPEVLAEGDVLLTASLLQYMHDLKLGRVDPAAVEDDVDFRTLIFDPPAELAAALGKGSLGVALSELRPPHPEYEALRAGLAHYRALVKEGAPENAQRVQQIIANMERWRWIHQPFEERYIEVNTADATLKVVDHGVVVLASRVIAGKPATPTPIFRATVEAVTINPYWSIPASIVRKEIMPKARRHRGYLAAHRMVYDDGAIRQKPGAGNSLGRIKLEMPNPFVSYLHDTPARGLFANAGRHLSHGCMRVELIRPLASYAISGSAEDALDGVNAAIATGRNMRLPLDRPLPVYVLYWTAIADASGAVTFVPDAYGRDAALLAALARQRGARTLADAE